ncbi:MAG: HYR domain-containing protein [candidate division Zixibacteria bacterium]|nr:HYR domain-containing protein [candidate division Zixibacteria bacterium]
MHVSRHVLRGIIVTALAAMLIGAAGDAAVWAGSDVCDCPFPGDASGDGQLDITDLVYTMDYIFTGGPASILDPNCPKSRGDWNADGILDVMDLVGASDHIFLGGPPAINPCDCLLNPPLCAPVVDPNPGMSGNTVVVESKTVFAGQTGVPVAIKLTNVVALRHIVVPLSVRSVTAGSFMSSVQMEFGDRLVAGVLTDVRLRNLYADPDGTCNPGGFKTITFNAHHDAVFTPQAVGASPEGLLFVAGTLPGNMHTLSPGADATGSLNLTMSVTSVPGSFEIDTTCIDPANHLVFIKSGSTTPPIVPAFTKGVITLISNSIPVAQCLDAVVPAGADCMADASVNNGSFDPDGGSLTLAQTPPGPYSKGTTNVTLVVTDVVGAKDTCQATVTVQDLTPPVLTCPDSVRVRIGPADTGAVITFASTASDNCPGVTMVCTPPPGSFFLRGATPVTCIATDAAGLADTCQFVVTAFSDCFDRMSDVNCDGVIDVFDVMLMIDVTFNNVPEVPCPGPK